jgi:hypothetical protein
MKADIKLLRFSCSLALSDLFLIAQTTSMRMRVRSSSVPFRFASLCPEAESGMSYEVGNA